MKKGLKIFLYIIGGIALFALSFLIGQFMGRTGAEDGDSLLRVSPIIAAAVYFGSGLLVLAILGHEFWYKRKHPEKAKQQEIEGKDERNIALADKAGFTAWAIITVLLFGSAGYAFILDFGVPFWFPLGLTIISFSIFIISRFVYNKKM